MPRLRSSRGISAQRTFKIDCMGWALRPKSATFSPMTWTWNIKNVKLIRSNLVRLAINFPQYVLVLRNVPLIRSILVWSISLIPTNAHVLKNLEFLKLILVPIFHEALQNALAPINFQDQPGCLTLPNSEIYELTNAAHCHWTSMTTTTGALSGDVWWPQRLETSSKTAQDLMQLWTLNHLWTYG